MSDIPGRYIIEVPITDSRHPTRKVVTLLGVASILNALSGWAMYAAGGSPTIGLVLAAGLLGVGASAYRFAPIFPYVLERDEGPEPSFCADCGRAYTTRQRQLGFDRSTGAPLLQKIRGCPDGDPTAPNPLLGRMSPSAAAFYGSSYPLGPFRWPDCGKKKTTNYTRAQHAHAQETDTTCPACIDQMVTDGVIDVAAAQKLYRAAGVQS